ncbi:MAG: hypothetical protein ACTHKY_03835, partial [Ginsengibacter sp.]
EDAKMGYKIIKVVTGKYLLPDTTFLFYRSISQFPSGVSREEIMSQPRISHQGLDVLKVYFYFTSLAGDPAEIKIFYLRKNPMPFRSLQRTNDRSIGFCRALARKNARSDRVFLELFGYFFFQEKK